MLGEGPGAAEDKLALQVGPCVGDSRGSCALTVVQTSIVGASDIYAVCGLTSWRSPSVPRMGRRQMPATLLGTVKLGPQGGTFLGCCRNSSYIGHCSGGSKKRGFATSAVE